MAGIDAFVVFGSPLDGADGATSATDFSTAQAAKTITFVDNAQIDTAQSVFGGAACLFGGTGARLTVPDSEDWNFGTGDFTIDFRMRTAVTTQDLRVFEIGASDSDGIHFQYSNGAGSMQVRINNNTMARTWSFSTNTWYHVAIIRTCSTVRAFIDGTQLGADFTNSSNITSGTQGLFIGDDTDGSLAFNGWIDEFRVSKGIARWTANFTPPTEAYSADASIK